MEISEEKLIDIVTNHPEQIRVSRGHRPGETYVKILGKRIYFTSRSPVGTLPVRGHVITGIYRKSRYGAYIKIKKFFQDVSYHGYWLHLFRPTVLFLILFSIAIFYFRFIESEGAKIRRVEKLFSLLTGYKSEYMYDGRIKLSGTRKDYVYGSPESVEAIIDPVGWLLGRDSEVKRYSPERGTITESFDYDGGEVWLHRENKKWIHGFGLMNSEKIKWDKNQGTGVRKEEVSATTVKNKNE